MGAIRAKVSVNHRESHTSPQENLNRTACQKSHFTIKVRTVLDKLLKAAVRIFGIPFPPCSPVRNIPTGVRTVMAVQRTPADLYNCGTLTACGNPCSITVSTSRLDL